MCQQLRKTQIVRASGEEDGWWKQGPHGTQCTQPRGGLYFEGMGKGLEDLKQVSGMVSVCFRKSSWQQ